MGQVEENTSVLRAILEAKEDNYVREFDEIFMKLDIIEDPAYIIPLISLFDDDEQYHEVMWGIIHAIEAFPSTVYLKHLIASLPDFIQNAPEYASILHIRILNSEDYLNEYCHMMKHANVETQTAFRRLIEMIVKDHPDFKEKTDKALSIALG